MSLLSSERLGMVLTVIALGLTFWSTALIEFGWGSVRVRRRVIGAAVVVFVCWLAVVALRFVVVG